MDFANTFFTDIKTRDIMKYLQTFFLSLIALMMAAGLCACSSDDNEPEQPEITDPTEEVDDPAGTITLSMRNENYGSTRLGRFYIDEGDNFANGYFASIGSVNGLGNISYIPKTGWASKISVTPGCGYVAYNEYDDTYYRIYVTGYIIGSTSGIIGAYVKYQTPFHGADADITLSTDNLVFDETGGQVVEITNTTIIPFTVESDADWCHVSRASTLDWDFLYNAIHVWVEAPDSSEPTTANVTITALNGKTKTFTVTRSGTKPYISCSPSTLTISPNDTGGAITIYSNIENVDDIVATSNVDWLRVERISKISYTSPTLKSIEGRDVSSIKATNNQDTYYYTLICSVDVNTGSERTGVITLSAPNAESTTFTLTQEGAHLTLSRSEYTASAASGSQDFRITTTIPAEKLSVSSSATWLEGSIVEDGQYKYLRTKWDSNGSEQERNATITVKTEELSTELTLIQNGFSLNINKSQLYFDRNASYQTITINCDAEYTLVSPEDWCTFSTNGNSVTIRVAETTVDRTTVLTFSGIETDKIIEINQSKYAVNDEYNENGVTGTVRYMNDDGTRIIIKDLETTAAWSTENVLIGANDSYDGRNNMTVVKAIPNWQELYPAFALVDALNVDGVTGWYLPASTELYNCGGRRGIWSSTERSTYSADTGSYYDYKDSNNSVWAAHRF